MTTPSRNDTPTIIAITLVTITALLLGAIGFTVGRSLNTPAPPPTAQSAPTPPITTPTPAPSPQSPTPTTQPPAETTPPPTCTDGTPAPDGTCLHPASVQWLPDLLPDPREVDRTDPEQVAIAYTITRNTWDASRDKSNAYAYIRASVYEVPERASSHTKTPDLEHGQGEFLPLLANRAHTTVTITGSNNHGQQPNTDPTRWYGNVYYLRNYSDDSLEPVKGREVVFLRLQDDGTWAVERHGIN